MKLRFDNKFNLYIHTYMNYYKKYLKYKSKYITMKRIIGGGDYEMKLDEPHFSNIKKGLKTIEGRIYDDKRKAINIGDTIKFINRNDSNDNFEKKVINLKVFTAPITFGEVINEENFKDLIPEAENVQEAVDLYENIDGYLEKAAKEGIVFLYF